MTIRPIMKNIDVGGNDNKIISGDDNSKNFFISRNQGKLAYLFERLKEKFEEGDKIKRISEDLKRYQDERDRISIEQKLNDANRGHLIDDFVWLKEQYAKKLTKFQFFEPAQEIHAFILGIVYEKFRNIIYPMIRSNECEEKILNAISEKITEPIVSLLQEEGCNDIMGLSATEVEGMIHFLTGQCHIKWKL